MRPGGYRIGDVLVILGEPPDGNPRFCLAALYGAERARALRALRDGDAAGMAGLTYWYAPWSGGVRRLIDGRAVDWSGLRS